MRSWWCLVSQCRKRSCEPRPVLDRALGHEQRAGGVALDQLQQCLDAVEQARRGIAGDLECESHDGQAIGLRVEGRVRRGRHCVRLYSQLHHLTCLPGGEVQRVKLAQISDQCPHRRMVLTQGWSSPAPGSAKCDLAPRQRDPLRGRNYSVASRPQRCRRRLRAGRLRQHRQQCGERRHRTNRRTNGNAAHLILEAK